MANPILANEKSTRSLSEFEFLHEPSDKGSKLGVGSFASVKLAKEKKTGKQYAIKIIDMEPSKITNSDLHNIKTEICIHRKIEHPNIIKFYDYIQKDHKIYFILDYAENGNLYSYIHKRKSLQPEEIFRFFHQTCLAFQYLHQNDILHRDLKPENLLLDKDRNVKLCDFGWSTKKITEKRTTFCGTYEYMAPEIVNKKTYDYRVDIWALGVLLYELIHKEAPYKGRSLPEISKSQAKTQITFSSNCPSGAKDLILKILRHNPEERISMALILSHPWVQSHLPAQADDDLHVEEYDVSPTEMKAIENLKGQIKRHPENFKSEIILSGHHEPLIDMSESQTRKHANANSFISFNNNVRSCSKEKEREKPKDRIKERLNFKDKVSTVSATLNSVETQRKSPLDMNYHLKTFEENILSTSRGHAKSSSSIANTILSRLDVEEKNNSNSMCKKKRVIDTSILSPTLKNKVDRIINQLSSHTTTHRMESISGVLTAKSVNRNSQVAQAVPTEALLSCKPQSEFRSILSTSRNQSNFKIITSNRADENSYSHVLSSSNSSRAKADLQKKLILPKNDSFHNISSQFYGRNLTTRPKFDKTPELFDFDKNSISSHKISGLETTKSSYKNSINVLSSNDQNKYRIQEAQDLTVSVNKLYKGNDYKRRQGLKTAEELHPTTMQFSSLSERRNENKENKKDFIKEKELQMRLREEYGSKWAF